MSGIEKAATVLNVLDKPLASRLLQLFGPDDLKKITSIRKTLQPISATELSGLIEDFANQFSAGLQMIGDQREIQGLLETVLTPEQVAQISTPQVISENISIWTNDSFSNQEVLQGLVEQEHPQTIAFILNKIDSQISAKMIGLISEDKRNDIMLRMLEMKTIRQEVLSMVEHQFRENFIENDNSSDDKETRARMAGIINNLQKTQADEFLEDLAVTAPEEIKELKKLLFSFEDIPILTAKDRLILFDNVETDLCVIALNGADTEIKEMVLSSFGTRVRKMVESELANSQNKDASEVEQARREIARVALSLAASNEISIILPDSD